MGWPTVAGAGSIGRQAERHSTPLLGIAAARGRSSSRAQGGALSQRAGPGALSQRAGGWGERWAAALAAASQRALRPCCAAIEGVDARARVGRECAERVEQLRARIEHRRLHPGRLVRVRVRVRALTLTLALP